MSCDCKKTGRYLGSFERCQVCLTPHYWGPSFVTIESRILLPSTTSRPLALQELGFAVKHRLHPCLVGHGPDERTAKVDLYRKEKTERFRKAYTKPAVHGRWASTPNQQEVARPKTIEPITLPGGEELRVVEARLRAPRYADGSEAKVGDAVGHCGDICIVTKTLSLDSGSAGSDGVALFLAELNTGETRFAYFARTETIAGVWPIREPDELAKTLREDDVIACVGGMRLRVGADRVDGMYTLYARGQAPFTCRVATVTHGLRGGDTIIRREQNQEDT